MIARTTDSKKRIVGWALRETHHHQHLRLMGFAKGLNPTVTARYDSNRGNAVVSLRSEYEALIFMFPVTCWRQVTGKMPPTFFRWICRARRSHPLDLAQAEDRISTAI